MAVMSFWSGTGSNAGWRRYWHWGLLPVVIVIAGLGVWRWMHDADYRVLFSGLADKEGGQVVAVLEQLDIPYRLNSADGAIEVPENHLHLARYRLAIAGVPKAQGADEAQSAMRLGLSSFQEQLARQRTLEAELAQSLALLEGVAAARVHLALPKQSAFLREAVSPAASVMLTLADGTVLPAAQLEAVRLMVAGSVPGLQAAQVSVMDRRGVLLAGAVAAEAAQVLPPVPTTQPQTSQPKTSQTRPLSSQIPQTATLPSTPAQGDLTQRAGDGFSLPGDWRSEILPGVLGVLALLGLWLLLRHHRQHSRTSQDAMETEQGFTQELNALRQLVAQDPRLAASVVKFWVQGT